SARPRRGLPLRRGRRRPSSRDAVPSRYLREFDGGLRPFGAAGPRSVRNGPLRRAGSADLDAARRGASHGAPMFLDYLLGDDPADRVFYFEVVGVSVVSIVLHELGHALAATWEGDPTPKIRGHLTWDPRVHMGWMSII